MSLIPAEMNVLRREKFNDLIKNIIDEGIHAVAARAEYVCASAPAAHDLIGASCTSELRIARKGRQHVTRQVDLRDYRYMTGGRIRNDVPHLLLRVVAAMRNAVIFFSCSYDSAWTLRTDFSQFRTALDFKPPALVVGQVPMESVDVVKSKHIYPDLHGIHREEMPGAV